MPQWVLIVGAVMLFVGSLLVIYAACHIAGDVDARQQVVEEWNDHEI
jgi:hypothetical protein